MGHYDECRVIEEIAGLQRANAELTERAEKAEKELEFVREFAKGHMDCDKCFGDCCNCPLYGKDES